MTDVSGAAPDDRLAVGVVGCGYWGPNLVRNLSENERARVAAIADLRPERLQAIASRAPGARLTTSPEDLLEDPGIDAVAIATPVSTHYELALRALEQGKHVLVAKPLAASVGEADHLIQRADIAGCVLMVDHTYVYTGAVRKISSLLEQRALGDLYYLDSVRVNLGLFQHDVNVIWDLAAHDFSIFTDLLGVEPVSVQAVGSSHSASGLEDVAYVTLEYEDSLLAHCHVNWLSPVKIRQTLIGGSERMLVWNDLAADEKVKVYDSGFDASPDDEQGLHRTIVSYRTGDVWIPRIERHEALAVELDHFVDCVREGTRPITGGEAGRRVVRLLEATSASLKAGGRAIELAEPVAG